MASSTVTLAQLRALLAFFNEEKSHGAAQGARRQQHSPDNLTNPKNWSVKYKYLLSGLCCLCTLNVGFGSSAPTSAIGFIAKDFGVAPEISDLITSLFLVGFIAGPTVWGPGSELVGRQIIYRVSMVCYTLVILGQALAPNIEVMLITRFFAGFFASAPLTSSGGALVDIWDPATRGHAVAIFAACVAPGPVCGPFAGGFVTTSRLGWRWVFRVVMIVSWVVTVAVGCIMPETFVPVLLERKAIEMRAEKPAENAEVYTEHEKHDWSFKGVVNCTFLRPLIMLYKEPILVLTTLYLSFVYGLLYAMFDAVPIVFYELRGFSLGKPGLVFISFGLGAIDGSAINFYYSLQYARSGSMCFRTRSERHVPLRHRCHLPALNWANTVAGCIAAVPTPVPFLFFKYGARIRAGCTFSPCIDLWIAKQLEIEDREAEEMANGKASEAEV
ncbi:MFS general substrate transporter [Athelia psychrophila]|uniref:MFS general substrate transporter n=1 Tax=Athelia psychrophila TaxID=1759441 RepID=A0A166QKT0_9AGAM|nr:MFS general substrate transporter [Fibularhizoctonia sp. CBS 109695]